jgi:hypothetical protein
MPLYQNDLQLIPLIIQTITHQITRHPNDHIILCGDFNRDIAFQGYILDSNIQPPQQPDYQWRQFTQTLGLAYISTNTTYTRQRGQNYTHTSLFDGYYTKSSNYTSYPLQTETDFLQNLDHFLVSLFLPNNRLLARPPPPTPQTNAQLLNRIPQKTLDFFNTTYFFYTFA